MRTMIALLMIITVCCTAVISQSTPAWAQTAAGPRPTNNQSKTPPPADGGDLVKVIDSISGSNVIPIPLEFYETQIVGHWANQLCIALSNNVNDMRCTTLKVTGIFEKGEVIYVNVDYYMALNDQANTYSNRGLHHNMWFGQPCGGGWIKGFVYHAGLPGNQVENIDHLPPPFPGLDVC